jgi:hypothetical protein
MVSFRFRNIKTRTERQNQKIKVEIMETKIIRPCMADIREAISRELNKLSFLFIFIYSPVNGIISRRGNTAE